MKIYCRTRVNATAIALFAIIGFTGACDSNESDECVSLYWFDNESTECVKSEFCDDYMYESLRTFDTLEACETAISAENKECVSLYWFDNESTECVKSEFCGDYMYESLRTFDTLEACEGARTTEDTLPDGIAAKKAFFKAEPWNVQLGQAVEKTVSLENGFREDIDLLPSICVGGNVAQFPSNNIAIVVAGKRYAAEELDSSLYAFRGNDSFLQYRQLAAETETALPMTTLAIVTATPYYLPLDETLYRMPDVENCGNYFVDALKPTRMLSYTLRYVFANAEDAYAFSSGIGGKALGYYGLRHAEDYEEISRFLRKKGAFIELSVFQGAGDGSVTQEVLQQSQCATDDLASCFNTLQDLETILSSLSVELEMNTPIDALSPTWEFFGNFSIYSNKYVEPPSLRN